MKRVAFLLSILSLTLIVCSCAAANTPDIPDVPDVSGTVNDGAKSEADCVLSEPYSFNSFEDFERHEKEAGAKAVSCYYTPSSLSSDYELAHITKRDDVYVSVEYSLSAGALSDDELNGYDAERLQTLICECSPYPAGQNAPEDFINNGYEAIEYEGKTYYRWDEHAENDPEKRAIGYEIVFPEDGNLIFMHLPAVDTFENMMKYADVVKVNID